MVVVIVVDGLLGSRTRTRNMFPVVGWSVSHPEPCSLLGTGHVTGNCGHLTMSLGNVP